MATLIDSLLISIGLDTSNLQDGTKKTDAAFKKVEDGASSLSKKVVDSGKKMGEGISGAKNEALGLLAVLAGSAGLGAALKNAAQGVTGVANAAQFLGTKTQDVMALGVALAMNGDSASDAQAGLAAMHKDMVQITVDATKVSDEFKFMWAAVGAKQGDTEEDLVKKANVWWNSDAGLEARRQNLGRAQDFLTKFLGGNQALAREAMKGTDAFSADMANAKKFTPSDEEVKRMKDLVGAFAEFGMALDKVMIDMASDIDPWLGPMLHGLSTWMAGGGSGTAKVIAEVGAALLTVASAVTALSLAMKILRVAVSPIAWLLRLLFGGAAVAETGAVAAGVAEAGAAIAGETAVAGEVGGLIAAGMLSAPVWVAIGLAIATAILGYALLNPDKVRDQHQEDEDRKLDPITGDEGREPGAPVQKRTWVQTAKDWLAGKNVHSRDPQKVDDANNEGGGGDGDLASTPFGKLVTRGEGDYNSVNRGAAGGYRSGTEDLEGKTVAEVMSDQANHKYNAAGRYQIIAGTLKSAVASMGLTGNEKFDRGLQDKIFSSYLAGTKRPEIRDYLSGKSNDLHAAQKAVSEEWASVADPDTGRSHYEGSGNNKASVSAQDMAKALELTRASRPPQVPSARPVVPSPSDRAPPPHGPAPIQSSMQIDNIHVHTRAKNADGISKDIMLALQKHYDQTFVQAQTGLT